MDFNDINIARLFGNEAAENEDRKLLKGYYFKNAAYDQVTGNMPLRILVGHKGIGKSALFRVAEMEDEENEILPIIIRPDDIVGIASQDADLLTLIRDWKAGLCRIIFGKVLEKFHIHEDGVKKVLLAGGMVLNIIAECLHKVKGPAELSEPRRKLLESFLKNNVVNVYIDDLDRGWEAMNRDIRRISALLNAVRDLSSDSSGLRFRISLRTDVYFLVRTSDEWYEPAG